MLQDRGKKIDDQTIQRFHNRLRPGQYCKFDQRKILDKTNLAKYSIYAITDIYFAYSNNVNVTCCYASSDQTRKKSWTPHCPSSTSINVFSFRARPRRRGALTTCDVVVSTGTVEQDNQTSPLLPDEMFSWGTKRRDVAGDLVCCGWSSTFFNSRWSHVAKYRILILVPCLFNDICVG